MEIPISGITFLKTRDLEATTEFYTKVLEFELALDQGKCRIFKICPNCFVGFCLTEGSTGSDEVILTIEVEDVDGICSYLVDQGVEIETAPRLNPYYNIYQMFLRDPNGYLLEIQRFLDPRWEAARS
jgi:catechol 2,3-dioxygenase-like lactoylglutathione lyase family enzyme